MSSGKSSDPASESCITIANEASQEAVLTHPHELFWSP